MPSRPTYRKGQPVRRADYDFNAHLGELVTVGKLYDFASTQRRKTIAQINGVGDVADVGGSPFARGTCRLKTRRRALFNRMSRWMSPKRSTALTYANCKGALKIASTAGNQTNDELKTAAEYQPLIIHYNNGAAVAARATSPASPTRCRMSVTPG